ncbi:unnamed protein product [Prunus armeniaca]
MDCCLLHELCVGVPWVAMDEIAKVGFAKTTFESSVSSPVICLWAMGILMAEAGGILPKGAGIQPIEPVQSSATESRRENEAHAFVTEALAIGGESSPSYASGHDNHALARHSWYEDVRSSPSSWSCWRRGAPPPPRDFPLPKVSFERNPHEGCGTGYRGWPRLA